MTTRSERLVGLAFALLLAVPGLGFVVVFQGLPRGEDGPVMATPEKVAWYVALMALAAGLLRLVWIAGIAVFRGREPRGYAAALVLAVVAFAVAMFAVSR